MTNNFIYSKIAAAGLFPDRAIKSIEVYSNAVNVHFFGHPSKLVSKKHFTKYFADSRRARGQKLRAQPLTAEVWQVESGHPTTRPEGYLVKFEVQGWEPRLCCECHDFAAQVEYEVETPCCKHVYSVLDVLGFDSYLNWIGVTDQEMERDRRYEYAELCEV